MIKRMKFEIALENRITETAGFIRNIESLIEIYNNFWDLFQDFQSVEKNFLIREEVWENLGLLNINENVIPLYSDPYLDTITLYKFFNEIVYLSSIINSFFLEIELKTVFFGPANLDWKPDYYYENESELVKKIFTEILLLSKVLEDTENWLGHIDEEYNLKLREKYKANFKISQAQKLLRELGNAVKHDDTFLSKKDQAQKYSFHSRSAQKEFIINSCYKNLFGQKKKPEYLLIDENDVPFYEHLLKDILEIIKVLIKEIEMTFKELNFKII